MNFKRFELIIFDLDGTLVNSAKDIMIANNKTLIKFGYKPINYKNIKNIIGQGIRVNIQKSLEIQGVRITKKKEDQMYDYFFSFYNGIPTSLHGINLFVLIRIIICLKPITNRYLDMTAYLIKLHHFCQTEVIFSIIFLDG